MKKNNWEKTKLGSFSPFIYGKGLLQKDRVRGNVPVFGSNGITDWHNESYVKNAGIIIGRKGSVGIIKLSKIPFWPIDTTFYIQDEPEKRNLLFTYYLLKTIDFECISSDSAVPGLNRDAAHSLEIKIPSLPEQKRIADILSSFDDKIELLQKQNKTLEDMAKAIFKSWFVDFDIVKAKERKEKKSKILNEYKITEEIYNLFPDSFEDSELGKIPKGWEVKLLGQCINCLDNKRVPLSSIEREKIQGTIPYYGATSIMDYVNQFIFDGIFLLMGEDGSVIRDNGTPFLQYIFGKSWVNNHAHVIAGKDLISTEFLYLFLLDFQIQPYVTGAVQLKINQGNMNRIPFIVATKKIHEYFDDNIKCYFGKTVINKKQIQTLTEIRDTLLPKLISGKIEV
jgi:type I restriction enzyme S subunit